MTFLASSFEYCTWKVWIRSKRSSAAFLGLKLTYTCLGLQIVNVPFCFILATTSKLYKSGYFQASDQTLKWIYSKSVSKPWTNHLSNHNSSRKQLAKCINAFSSKERNEISCLTFFFLAVNYFLSVSVKEMAFLGYSKSPKVVSPEVLIMYSSYNLRKL